MLRKILSYGTVGGLFIGGVVFVLTVTSKDHMPYGMVIGYLTMLVGLSTVFAAIKRQRDTELGGVIRFWPAFGLGIGITLVASVLYVIAWEAALAVTHMDFGGVYANILVEQEKAKGVSGEALAKFSAEMEQFRMQYASPLYRMPMTFTEIFPLGLLVSLVSAALLRNSRFLPARRG
ncbi:MAG: DUF4199 domain-containing protein [Dokdonella sp.]